MQPLQPTPQETPGQPVVPRGHVPLKSPVRPFLKFGLLAAILGAFFSYARSGIDWEMLQTKHYWDAQNAYYGGYAAQFFATPRGYRTFVAEGLCNYTNMLALEETAPAHAARRPVQGFPGTERLATPFLVSALLHAPGEGDTWRAFWQANVLLWVLGIILAYKVAKLFFPDPCSPLYAAILVALYPALTLTFGAIKQQPLGTLYLLFGIYLFEGPLGKAGFLYKAVVLSAVMFFGQFADGGWLFLAAFLFLRAWWMSGRARWTTLLCLGLAVGVSEVGLVCLGRLYHLPSVTTVMRFSAARICGDSWRWLATWLTGGDLGTQSFLNFPGATFFSIYWPIVSSGFLSIHAPLLLLAVAGLFLEPRTRMFTFLAAPMLFVGHSGTIVAGWLFYYGYLSFPAALMLIFAASGVLGNLSARRTLLPRFAALAAAAYVCWTFSGLKRQAGIYYGAGPEYFTRNVEVRYGDEREPVIY